MSVMFVAVAAALLSASLAQQSCDNMVWPLPQQFYVGTGSASLAPQSSFEFQSSSPDEVLSAAFTRYSKLIFGASSGGAASPDDTVLNRLVVTFQQSSKDVPLQVGADARAGGLTGRPITG